MTTNRFTALLTITLSGAAYALYTTLAFNADTEPASPESESEFDAWVPCEHELYVAPVPWEQVQQTVLQDHPHARPQIVACALSKSIYMLGAGPAFAVTAEPGGMVALYHAYGDSMQIAAAYESVRAGYILPDSPWELVCRGECIADLWDQLATDTTGIGRQAFDLFAGGPDAGLRQWITTP